MWEKLGLVHVAKGDQPWAMTHAFIPTSWMADEDRIRVYSAFVDDQGIGRVGAVDVAFTEAAVGAGVTTVFFVVTVLKTERVSKD